jgi:hypothetical protein
MCVQNDWERKTLREKTNKQHNMYKIIFACLALVVLSGCTSTPQSQEKIEASVPIKSQEQAEKTTLEAENEAPDKDLKTGEKVSLAPASGLIIKTTDGVVETHLYNKDGWHTGPAEAPEGSDLDFFESQVPNSTYYIFGHRTYISLNAGDTQNDGDDYYRIEIAGLRYGTTEFTLSNGSNENDLSKIYFPVGPSSKGTMTIQESEDDVEINGIQYDINGDGTTDYELIHKDGVSADTFIEMVAILLDTSDLAESEKEGILQMLSKVKDIPVEKDKKALERIITETFGDVFSNEALQQDDAELGTYEAFLKMVLISIQLKAEFEN